MTDPTVEETLTDIQWSSYCPHQHVEEFVTGGWHFDGEPWDDIQTSLICLDCGETVPDPDF